MLLAASVLQLPFLKYFLLWFPGPHIFLSPLVMPHFTLPVCVSQALGFVFVSLPKPAFWDFKALNPICVPIATTLLSAAQA